MIWCSFDSNLCSLIFYSCSLSSYLCYSLYLFPPTNIFCLYPPHPISRYFCKESLITPPSSPPTHQPTSSLFAVTVTPPKIFIVLFPSFSIRVHSFSIRVHSCSFVFHSCSLAFIRVHSCSTRVHSCSTCVHSCSLVFTRVHSCSFVFHSCSLVFTRVHSCSFVFTRVHSCSFVFRSVWCFRYDRQNALTRGSQKNAANFKESKS